MKIYKAIGSAYDAHLVEEGLRRVEQVKDMDDLLDSSMTFKSLVDQVIGREKSTLFYTLVRPLLKYCSVVWDPLFAEDRERSESVQRQFLLIAFRGLG